MENAREILGDLFDVAVAIGNSLGEIINQGIDNIFDRIEREEK